MNTLKRFISLAICLLIAGSVPAGEKAPALMVKIGKKSVPLGISKVDVKARVFGSIAETSMTLTFHNPHKRVLAGDLYFPLPEGASVSGYALDVNGVMVDGVVVEKQKARQVFEKEIRKGIDPGLVQWSKGNNFKTRVFPIPAGGSRTVMVKYVADLIGEKGRSHYRLPLHFKNKIPEFRLLLQVLQAEAPPEFSPGALESFKFDKWERGYQSEVALKDAVVDKSLTVTLPIADKLAALVEKTPDGEYYFVINDFPEDIRPDKEMESRSPKHIAVLWDASGSRTGADLKREIELLQSYFAQEHFRQSNVTVELVLFRNVAAAPESFVIVNGNTDALVQRLRKIQYDGGTQMGSLKPVAKKPDFYLLFTDGISNFGKEEPAKFDAPIYIFSSDARTNHPFLRHLALKSGGAYYNLNSMDNAAAVGSLMKAIGSGAFSFLAVGGENIKDTYPSLPTPVTGEFTLVGKLTGDTTEVTINYGAKGILEHSQTFTLNRADAIEGNLLEKYWAQAKIDQLMTFQKKNEKEITELGKQYSIVTPGTSLLVLERLEQYVEHRITPPKTLPEMYKKYGEIMEKQAARLKKYEESKLSRVLAMWQQHVKWWETEFKYPAGFKYKDKGRRKTQTGESSGRPAAMAPVPADAPEELEHLDDDDDDDDDGDAEAAEEENERRDQLVLDSERSPDATTAPRPSAPAVRMHWARASASAACPEKDKAAPRGPASITLKAWDPKTPYLASLKAAQSGKLSVVYMEQRKTHGKSPAFFLDCADYLLKQKQNALAIQVLSNIAEMELENASLLRILARRLVQIGECDLGIMLLEEVKKMRPEEPQSYRDLGLALVKRAEARPAGKTDDYTRAMKLLAHVVMNRWDRFNEIELIALMELNRLIPKAKAAGIADIPVDNRLVKLLDVDVRIIMSWDADLTDIDLHVTEPSGETCVYNHNRTTIGGHLSRDFTQGYGPEEYLLKKSMKGKYTIKANYYGSRAVKLLGAVTLQLDIFTNYGRPDEKRQSITLRLVNKKDMVTVGEIEF